MKQESAAFNGDKPMKQESAAVRGDGMPRNIGAQIMESYDEKMQKLRETLPDVSLLDVNATLEDIERERRRIIENQTVRAKKINFWVKNESLPDDTPDDLLEMENVSSGEEELPSSTVPDIVVSVEGPETARQFNTLDADVETCTSDNTPDGEVLCDSIIQNKDKTKNYWEQLMMAATASEQQRAPFKRELFSLGSDGEGGKPSSDVSEQEYYDARSQISLHSPTEPLDSLDQTYDFVGSGPKIVETVAKKLMESESVKLNKSVGEESFIEMDIRLQREREAALAAEREEAILRAAAVPSAQVIDNSPPVITVSPVPTSTPIPSSAETKIALELREMREREEELRRFRQRLSKDDPDDGFNSIPNTDEGNFSEYGSEEKELSLDGNNSRMMSPEVLADPESFLHQRTQSMDSMSSGHSSGSGSGTGHADITVGRRRITVKPLDEPDEEIPGYTLRNQKETPIEREIRLAREREEELRKEKGLLPVSQPSPAAAKEVRRINNKNTPSNDPRSLQHRLATSRIQQEIDEATEREKELREAGMIQTMSEDTVDSKVTRFSELAEFSIEKQDRKLKKSVSASHIPQSGDETETQASISPTSVQKIQNSDDSARTERPFRRSMSQSPSAPTLSPRKFPTSGGQKGLMQRFLATRGKMGSLGSGYVTVKTSPSQTAVPVPVPVPTVTDSKPSDKPVVERKKSLQIEEKENDDVQPTFRRGYITAGEKIQVEMQEMQKREEELRLQRALSQPNLLYHQDGEDEESPITNGNEENHIPLRGTLSNPHLLDMDTTPHNDSDLTLDKPFKTIRKRSALIAQWENMIQQNIEH